jgi:hypothetical protein
MKMISYTLLLLASCGDIDYAVKPEGEFYVTPRHGVAYYGAAQDAAGIDEAADLWLEWCRVRSVDPGATLQACAVYVREGATVDGVHAGYWWPNGVIEVARSAPYGADGHMELDSYGLLWLRHEWLHELYRDASHERFPIP